MIMEMFTALVAGLAVAYAGFAKFVQSKLIDRSAVESIQAESKKLSEEFKKAKETGNQKKMDEAMKRQLEFMPKMNKVMMMQFKPMFVILGVFLALNFVVSHIDPTVQDDLLINMSDDGLGCDDTAGDGVWSACHDFKGGNYGKWTLSARALENGAEIGKNETYVLYNPQADEDTYTEMGTGAPLIITADKRVYYTGETARIYVLPAKETSAFPSGTRPVDVDAVRLQVSNGTYFRVDLPFTIPVFNVQRIYQPYWWFILISFVCNISLSVVLGRLKKGQKR